MRHLPHIYVDVIPHKSQKYETAGNYTEQKNFGWFVEISKMEDWRYEFLVLMHELTEMALTKNDGVKWKDIDEFDINGEGKDHDDPGILKSAPYHSQHMSALKIEKMLCKMLGVDFETYDESFNKLKY